MLDLLKMGSIRVPR